MMLKPMSEREPQYRNRLPRITDFVKGKVKALLGVMRGYQTRGRFVKREIQALQVPTNASEQETSGFSGVPTAGRGLALAGTIGGS